jgi:multidrug transporter EmrE-like cation transporter
MRTSITAIILVLVSTLFMTAGQVSWKIALRDIQGIAVIVSGPFLIGCLFYAVAAVLFISALRNGELSVIYPVTATSFIWVALVTPMFFPADVVTTIKWVGVIAVLFGVSLIGLGSDAS